MYLPYQQVPDSMLFYTPKELVVRSSAEPTALVPAIRRIVRQADPELPLASVRTLNDIVTAQTSERVTQLTVLGVFAALSLLLAGLGVHGLLSFAVSQRIPEIGLRMALGARTTDILRMVLRQGLVLASVGCALGLGIGYAVGRWIEALLAGVKPADLPSFVSAVVLALIMSISGSLFPTLRAARVDPTTVIRTE